MAIRLLRPVRRCRRGPGSHPRRAPVGKAPAPRLRSPNPVMYNAMAFFILFLFGLVLAFAALRLMFWFALWLAIQPIRAVLAVAVAVERELAAPAQSGNVVSLPRRTRD